MGKQAKPSTETTQSQPPAFVSAAQQSMLGNLQTQLSPYMMGGNFNPDQLRAYEMTRKEAENPTQVPFMSMPGTTIGDSGPMLAATMQTPEFISAARSDAAQLDPSAYQAFMNPYTSDVINTTLDAQRREMEKDLNTVRGRTAAASAFGGAGARGALQETQLTNDYGQRRDAMVAQLRSQGFSEANARAAANTQLEQQARLANTQLEQQARQFNTSNLQQAYALNATNQQSANAANMQADLQRVLAQSNLDQTASQFNAGGQNTMGLANAGLQSQALQNLLGIGNQQYQAPLDAAKIYAASIPQQYGSTSNTVKSAPQSPSMLQQLLGVGLSIGGAPMTGGTSLFGLLGNGLFGSKG